MANTSSKSTKALVEGALLVALAFIFANFTYSGAWLQGGSISFEMVPIIIMGYRHGYKWGLLTGFAFGLLNMILGFSNVMYCDTLIKQIGCILLDYLVAFSVLGLSDLFLQSIGKTFAGYTVSTVIVSALRFVCHFISGIWLWGAWAPEGQPAWLYSLIYNGSYMVVDAILAVVIIAFLFKGSKSILEKQ